MLRKQFGVGIGVVALVAMGALGACSNETPVEQKSPHSVTPTEKNLSPTGGNLFAPGAPVTTTTISTGTNNNNPPPRPPGGDPAHGSGRGAAGPGGPGGPGGGPGGR